MSLLSFLNRPDANSERPEKGRRWRAPLIRTAAIGTTLALAGAALVTMPASAASAAEPALTGYVNPFIGSKDEGNTYPGATVPFGMVQFSPDTGHNTGYSYDGDHIRGFSLVHLSGVGCGLGGFLPVLPTTGEVTSTDYGSYALPFSHDTETASPGSYSTDLEAAAGTITAELGATTHTGVQKYTFPATTKANVLINAGQALSSVVKSSVEIVDDTTVDTAITLQGFCRDTEEFTVHTRTTFDRPFETSGTWTGDTVGSDSSASSTSRTGAWLRFDTTSNQSVEAQTSLSYVDADGAQANLDAEATTLADARAAASATWEQRLESVKVTSSDQTQLKTFYSALYRSFLAPNTGTDVDGRYQGWDDKPHTAEGFTYYQNYSLWDTYRTQQQMLALLAPEESADMAYSLVRQAQEGGWAPRWGYGPVETNIMTGDPITPFLVTAWSQGLLAGHEEEAYAILKQNADEVPPADSPYNGRAANEQYIAEGFVPYDESAEGKPGDYDLQHGGSATLEYALADATLSAMATGLGHDADAARYAERSQNYRSIWDSETKSFRSRTADGIFVTETDPAEAPGFHEGTAAQYEWLVQQDMPGLVDLLGGKQATADRLDKFFVYDKLLTDPAGTARNEWVNGAYSYYGQDTYNPNNEPDLHSPYAYLWAGEPWKTTDVVRAALTLFTDGPTGVTGNDDLGQMSSWAVMTSIGLYPIVPGTDLWGLSTPVFDRVELTLAPEYYPAGSLVITADGVSADSHYTQSVTAGGTPVEKAYLTGDQLTSATTLDYTVGSTPSAWATGADAAPGALVATDSDPSRLSAGVTPSTVTVAAGEEAALAVTVLAQGPGTISGTLEVTGSDDFTIDSGSTWSVDSNGLPAQDTIALTLAAKEDVAPGSYPVHLAVADDAGHAIERDFTVIVAQESPLQSAFNNKGIGDRGENNADLDNQGAYFIRDLMAPAGLSAGITREIPGSGPSAGLSYILGGAVSGSFDNITAAGQTTRVGGILADATTIAFVGAATSANQTVAVKLNYSDGTTATENVTLTDWCSGSAAGGNVSVGKASARWSGNGVQNIGCGLWATAPVSIPAGKTLASITWPTNRDFHVFAIASDAAAGTPVATTAVSISGDPVVGETVTASAPTWDIADVETTYRWSRDGRTISGATSKSYDVRTGDLGAELRVTAIGRADGYAAGKSTSQPVTVTAGTIGVVKAPAITGEARVGSTLAVSDGEYSVADASFGYAWFADGEQLEGETGSTLELTDAELGAVITARVTATRNGYEPLTTETVATDAVAPAPVGLENVAPPVVTGTAAVGKTLSASTGEWESNGEPASGLSFRYQWLRDGAAISGATKASYTLTSGNRGAKLAVRVTASGEGFVTASAESTPTKTVVAGTIVITKAPAISGTAKVGKTLKATAGKYAVSGVKATYRWLRDGKSISAATASSYKVRTGDKGHKLSLKVTLTRTGYATRVYETKATATVR